MKGSEYVTYRELMKVVSVGDERFVDVLYVNEDIVDSDIFINEDNPYLDLTVKEFKVNTLHPSGESSIIEVIVKLIK